MLLDLKKKSQETDFETCENRKITQTYNGNAQYIYIQMLFI